MEADCPFWAQQRMCNSNKCAICECDPNEIPNFWKKESEESEAEMFGHSLVSTSIDCPTTVSGQWCSNDEEDPKAIYVDLEVNVESFTAYNGNDIWGAIYSENCNIDKHQKTQSTCSEETLLYHMVSGLHASVNTHVARNFVNMQTNEQKPNLQLYHQLVGNHTDRVQNLFLVYAAGLRALSISYELLHDYNYNTGLDKLQDADSQRLMEELLRKAQGQCQDAFKETQLFQPKYNDEETQKILSQIQTKFFNISRILDCIACEKCRLNGKLQTKGLGVIMRILFLHQKLLQNRIQLTRTEIIALINFVHKLSESINYYYMFQEMEINAKWQLRVTKLILSGFAAIMIAIVNQICCRGRKPPSTPRKTDQSKPDSKKRPDKVD